MVDVDLIESDAGRRVLLIIVNRIKGKKHGTRAAKAPQAQAPAQPA